MTLPIFNGAKYGAAIDEASARLRATQSDRRRVEDSLRREIAQAHLRVRTALLQIDLLHHTHIPHAEQALGATESGYRTGSVPFADLVDTLRSIESIQLEHVAARADFEKAYADLEKLVGGDLPRPSAATSTVHARRDHE